MKTLTEHLDDYLTMRRGFGYSLDFPERVLRKFTAFADRRGMAYVTVALFLDWRKSYGAADNNTWFARLCMVRKFAIWLQSIDPRTQVPPPGLIPHRSVRPKPFIYTDEEVGRIVTEASKLRSDLGIRGLTCSTLFGLIAVTGLRVNEALGLVDDDIDSNNGVIAVRNTKNGSDRIVPITPCTVDRLGHYREECRRLLGKTDGLVFLKDDGTPLGDCAARYNFALVGQRLGMRQAQRRNRHGRGPRIHDLRHTFAVRTIIDWYRADLDANREMYKLSAVLGHTHPDHTYWYIEAVPELLKLASDRAKRNIAGRRR